MITFRQAADTVIPFGKYRGSTIDAVAETDDGLLYLDWLYGERGTRQGSPLDEALKVYLEDPTIAKELSILVARSGQRQHNGNEEQAPEDRDQRRLRESPLRGQQQQQRERR